MSLMFSELAPPSHITVFRRAINLCDKLFHQPQLVRVFFPEMLFANVSSLLLPVLSPQTHRRLELAVVNDCRNVSPLFRWQAYYRRQHLSRHPGRGSLLPRPMRPPDLMRDLQRLHSRIGSTSEGSSFSGCSTRWLIGHIFISSAGYGFSSSSDRHPRSHPAISRDALQPG